MGADACFRIGANHEICQDYALAGLHKGQSYAFVSDGCSGSPHTDYGSRFLVRVAHQQLCHESDTNLESDSWSLVRSVDAAEKLVRACGFALSSLDATLLRARQIGNQIVVHQAGDGVVAARHRESRAYSYRALRFGGNMPYYLSYMLNLSEREKYFALAQTHTKISGSCEPGQAWESHEETVALDQSSPVVHEYVFGPEYDLVLIMSDGVESFTCNGQPVSLHDVLMELLDFKGYEGEFIIRRCNKFLKKICLGRNWKHSDDLSVAGIYRNANEGARAPEAQSQAVKPSEAP